MPDCWVRWTHRGTHLLTDIPTEPVSGQTPNVVLVPRGFEFTTKAEELSLIWRGDEVAVYAALPGVTPVVDQPPPRTHNFAVRLSDVRVGGDRLAFTATFDDQAPERWTGQDWLVIEVDQTPLALPAGLRSRWIHERGDTVVCRSDRAQRWCSHTRV